MTDPALHLLGGLLCLIGGVWLLRNQTSMAASARALIEGHPLWMSIWWRTKPKMRDLSHLPLGVRAAGILLVTLGVYHLARFLLAIRS